jgi:hypothetical protein
MWWGYHEWAGHRYVGTEDNRSFGYDLGNKKVMVENPDELVFVHNGKKEEAAVTPAQYPSSLVEKSWYRETGEPLLNRYDSAHPENPWVGIADLKFRYVDNELEVSVPRKLLGFTGNQFTFDFE